MTRTAEFRELRVEQLVECPKNPRTRFDPDAMAELVASVRDHGVLTPLLVRPRPAAKGQPGAYEIGAGHRRFRAAKEAGLEQVPAIVREMDDESFIELLNLENLQRADLNALEEAEGYRQLLALPGRDVHAVAARVSRSVKYVYDRLKLLELIPEARELLLSDEITVGHAILIARLSPTDQALVIEEGLFLLERTPSVFWQEDEDFGGRKPVSVRELATWISDKIRFDHHAVDEVLHPETHATLFAAQAAEEAERVVPITALHQVPPSARADERTVCRASWKRADGEIDRTDWAGTKPTKTCEHSVLGVVVVGPGRGETFRVCTAKKHCRIHWGKEQKEAARSKGATNDWKARRAKEQERWAREREKQEQARKAWAAVLPRAKELLEAAIAEQPCTPEGPLGKLLLDSKRRASVGATADDLVRAIALDRVSNALLRSDWDAGAQVEPIAKLLGVDLKALRKEVQTSAKPNAARKKASKKKVGRRKKAIQA